MSRLIGITLLALAVLAPAAAQTEAELLLTRAAKGYRAASAYHFMNIPTSLFTPIFVMSRLTGWAAHVKEQRANNRIIRPSAEYTGPETSEWVDIGDR